MPHADDPSLPEHARSPVLVLLRGPGPPDRAAEYAEMLAHAGAAPPVPHVPKHRRDRHGMYGIRGGMAAFAPAAFLGGRGWVVAAFRWLWCTHWNRARMVAAALALGVMGATGSGTVAGPLPHARAAACTGQCEARQDAVQSARRVSTGERHWTPVRKSVRHL